MKKRNSNIELLRITAMLMIITYHIFRHCMYIQLTDISSITTLNNGWFSYPSFFKRLCILAVISPMGQIGNAIFLIISGYFMADKKSIDLTTISKKLLYQLGFATLSLGLISIIFYKWITLSSTKLMSFNLFNWSSWYIGYYFLVIVFAKIFLNKYLNKIKQKNYLMFLISLFAITQFSWTVSIIKNIANGLETLITGIFLYTLGGYIKKYNPFTPIKTWVLIAIIVIINITIIGNFYIDTTNNILAYIPSEENIFIQYIPVYENYQIIPIILGITTFELFRRIKLSNNKIINFIGASTFMIYLIHDNEFVHKIWKSKDWITLLNNSLVKFIVTFGIWVLVTFITGFILYCIYLLMEKVFNILKPLLLKKDTMSKSD